LADGASGISNESPCNSSVPLQLNYRISAFNKLRFSLMFLTLRDALIHSFFNGIRELHLQVIEIKGNIFLISIIPIHINIWVLNKIEMGQRQNTSIIKKIDIGHLEKLEFV
jgi:hypothetical protein